MSGRCGLRRAGRLAVAAVLTVGAAALQAAAPGGRSRIEVEGHRVEVASEGSGASVVLQAGLGDGLEVWAKIWPALSRGAHLYAYSRPGYGGSDRVGGDRDSCTIAREWRAVLRAQGAAPPYVLVGHSLGGLYAWVFAALYPAEVRSIVLLDPTHPEHWSRLQRDAPKMALVVKVMRGRFAPPMRAEFDAQSACLDALDRAPARTMTARLLVRTQYGVGEGGDFRNVVEDLQQRWLTLLAAPRGVEPVEGSGHYLQKDRPELVVRAIQDALQSPR